MTQPLAVDLFTGLHGWSEGLEEAGYYTIGVDIEDMSAQFNQAKPNNFSLLIQDVRTIHGSQFKRASLIVASPPCQEFSYMAMPWKRARQIARALRGEDDFPENYRGSRTLTQLTELVDACYRIQREASDAAGHYIPMVLENVCGAQQWIGRAEENYGSFFFWADVPVIMPKRKYVKVESFRFDGSGRSFQTASVRRTDVGAGARFTSRDCGIESRWFNDGQRHPNSISSSSSSSPRRKAASAKIAKIPIEVSSHVARYYHPDRR